jgi:hypothetical protein
VWDWASSVFFIFFISLCVCVFFFFISPFISFLFYFGGAWFFACGMSQNAYLLGGCMDEGVSGGLWGRRRLLCFSSYGVLGGFRVAGWDRGTLLLPATFSLRLRSLVVWCFAS